MNIPTMIALFAAVAGSLSAAEAAKEGTCASAACSAEQQFVSKLSAGHQKMFSIMSADEKKAAIAAATDGVTPDQAVDRVISSGKHVATNSEAKAEKK